MNDRIKGLPPPEVPSTTQAADVRDSAPDSRPAASGGRSDGTNTGEIDRAADDGQYPKEYLGNDSSGGPLGVHAALRSPSRASSRQRQRPSVIEQKCASFFSTLHVLEKLRAHADERALVGLVSDETLTSSVREFVSSLSNEELVEMSLASENELLRVLAEEPDDPANRVAIRRLYETQTQDRIFDRSERASIARVRDMVVNDERIVQDITTWTSRSNEERIDCLQRLAEVTGAGLGVEIRKIETHSSSHSDDGPITPAYVLDGTIHLNLSAMQMLNAYGFADAIIHEVAHLYQAALAEQVANRRLSSDDPRHTMATAFLLNHRTYVYDAEARSESMDEGESARDFEARSPYLNQPLEVHARAIALAVCNGLKSADPEYADVELPRDVLDAEYP